MSKYMLLHAAFRDEEIIELWAKREDVHAEYGNVGVYEGYKNVTDYHRGRPNPPGKWIFHSLSNEVLEVAADGKTAKGVWLLSGTESGHGPAQDNNAPENFYCEGIFDGCRVWAHWVWSRYGVDFIKEDGTWKFWHFHNYELLRTPFDENWVTYNMRLVKEKSGKEKVSRRRRSNMPGIMERSSIFLNRTGQVLLRGYMMEEHPCQFWLRLCPNPIPILKKLLNINSV